MLNTGHAFGRERLLCSLLQISHSVLANLNLTGTTSEARGSLLWFLALLLSDEYNAYSYTPCTSQIPSLF